ncbi:MAG: endo-1,4-beta-xylanase [Gemmatimonadetes bacterium]|jgi:endo-1,4-beta-xylanase|nr:endo-1,4-beta-xylanase [Gemmatimonadota bacterium]
MRLLAFATAALSVIACAHPAPSPSARPTATSLKDAYRGAFKLGVAINAATALGTDSATQALVVREFNSITADNFLKAALVNPQPGVYDFRAGDAFVALGERQKMFIVGHTLVWHNQTPPWFFTDSTTGKPNTPAQQKERLRSHIQAVAGHYAGRIHAWDVVNEVIGDDGAYRPTTWVKGVGDGDTLVTLAFRYAAQYAPNTELYYNDFNAWRPAKRDGIVRLVRMLKKQGIRIDGVGMQGHWGLNYPETRYIEAAIDSFTAAGVKVMITELDVDVLPITREGQVIGQSFTEPQWQNEEFKRFLDPYATGLPDAVQRQLTARYVELFDIFWRKRDKLDRVTFWGAHDGLSWKNGYPVPGRTNYPLLFDRARHPKPAYEAVLAVPQSSR